MKKIYSLFIFSILALTMFVGCQMPTDGTETTDTFNVSVNEDARTLVNVSTETSKALETVYVTVTVPEDYTKDDVIVSSPSVELTNVDTDETDKVVKSFIMPSNDVKITVDLDDYYIYYDGKLFKNLLYPKSMIDEKWIKECNLVKDTDYTWGDRTFNVTKSGVQKIIDALTYTITVNATHGTASYPKTAKVGEKVTIKVTADSGYVFNNATNAFAIPDTKVSDDKTTVTFTFEMPEKDVTINVTFKVATPTDDNGDGEEAEDPVDDTPTVDTDETTYGFVKTVNYTVVANGQSLPGTKTGAELIAIAKAKNLVKDTDYTIDGTTVTLTASGVEKVFGQIAKMYSISANASDGYFISGGKFEAGKTVTLPILLQDGTGSNAPTGLYLVKVHIKEGETELTDIPVTVTKDHKIQFTMPEKNINVFAEFCDIRYQTEYFDGYKARVKNYSDNEVTVVLCFNSKAYDNLDYKKISGKYVLEVDKLEKHFEDNTTKDAMYFTSLCDDYELSKDGTLNYNQYTFGVIDNGELKILKVKLGSFTYNPNQGLQSN